jgi:hypothetical protein
VMTSFQSCSKCTEELECRRKSCFERSQKGFQSISRRISKSGQFFICRVLSSGRKVTEKLATQ